MKGYKLTTQAGTTKGDTQWGENVTHETNGSGELCGPGWLHYYREPLLAVLHNPIHAYISDPVLWTCRVEGQRKNDGWMKSGCTKLTPLRQIPLPEVTTTQHTAYAILCAMEVYNDPAWRTWAQAWLDGTDRTTSAAEAAAAARAAEAAWAAAANKTLNLLKLARKAMKVKA